MLAQLLIQFQKPIDVPNPTQAPNVTNDLINDSSATAFTNNVSRFERSIQSFSAEMPLDEDDNVERIIKKRFITSENENGKVELCIMHLHVVN